MENMKGYESYQQICNLISYFVVYTGLLCSCFLMRSAQIKLTRAEYSGALIPPRSGQSSEFVFVICPGGSHPVTREMSAWLWLMRDKISSHIHYISVSRVITGVQPSRERQLIDTIIHQNNTSLVSPHSAQFCSQSICGVSHGARSPLNQQNELRGIFHHLF